LADTYILMANYGIVPPTEVWPKAKQAVVRALELDDSLAEAHSSLGLIRSFYEWDWTGAEEEFRRAVDLGPGNANEHLRYAAYLSRVGRHREAIREMERAREIDPLSLEVNNALAVTHYVARQYDKALRQLHSNLDLADDYYRTYWNLGRCYLEQGRFEEALDALQKARELSGNNPFMTAVLAHAYGRCGQEDRARELLEELRRLSTSRYVSPASVVLVHIGLDDRDAAFAALRDALRERSGSLVWLKVDPVFDRLRPDPRFPELLRQVGLPQ
jgi:Tfp pilus assembly protein PilF